MVAHCKPAALNCAMEFALTLSDEDIHQIAAGLLLEQHDDNNADYILAACLLDGFIALRHALKLIGEGKLVPAGRP